MDPSRTSIAARSTHPVKPFRPDHDRPSTWRFALWSSPFVLAALAYCLWHIVTSLGGNARAWVVGDWLINYSDGFVRRGLTGSILLEIARLVSIGPATLTYGVVFSLFTGWVLLFFANVAAYRSPLLIGLVLLSPLVLLFNGADDALLRKENLFFALIAWLSLSRSVDTWRWYIPVLFAPLLILCHEAIFAWIPALLAIVLIRKPAWWLIGWLVLASVAAMTACLIDKGNMAQARHICATVNGFAQTDQFAYCRGAIAALGGHIHRFIEYRYFAKEAEQAGLCLGLYIVPFIFFLSEKLTLIRHRLIVAATLVALSALAVPLGVIATDVGRWLRAIFICSATVAAACRFHENRSGFEAPVISTDRRWLHAVLIYELVVMTFLIGVHNIDGPYFGFSDSLSQLLTAYL